MKNNKGQMAILIFFAVIFVILVLGLVLGLVISIVGWGSEEITPVMESLGVVESANLSQAGEYTFGNLDKVINTFTWLGGVIYLVGIIACIMFVVFVSDATHPAFITLFLAFLLLLIFFSIMVSNAYEDLYNANDEIGIRLQAQTILSFMVLYSPAILTAIAFITGIFIFVKNQGGGYT